MRVIFICFSSRDNVIGAYITKYCVTADNMICDIQQVTSIAGLSLCLELAHSTSLKLWKSSANRGVYDGVKPRGLQKQGKIERTAPLSLLTFVRY